MQEGETCQRKKHVSGFYNNNSNNKDNKVGGVHGGRSGCGDQSGRGGRGIQGCQRRGNEQSRIKCHNCGKLNHMERTCWVVGGGAHGKNVNEENNVTDFPGVDNEALRFPP